MTLSSFTSPSLLLGIGLNASLQAGLKFEVKLLMVDPNEACAIADFNKDGVLDVSAGRNWYAGPDYTARPLREIGELGRHCSVNPSFCASAIAECA